MAVVSGAGFRGEILGAIENARTPYGDQTKTVSVKGDATTNEGSSPRWTWRAMDPFDRLNAQSPDSYPTHSIRTPGAVPEAARHRSPPHRSCSIGRRPACRAKAA